MKAKTKYDQITEARKILELPESATLQEVKRQYKKLMAKWHPDKSREKKEICEEKAKKINEAYKEIMNYCNNYSFSFSKEEVEKYITEEEWWFKRFGNDPVWGVYNDKS
ncbi:MAG: J domain-containing protein [Deltaproteobacteria bacterium]|nr:J domain-containing protein [Deltaproteobacteria bacterium]RLB90055.1 MAG: J domain-containing protein [Deltaproteobacteria bacterium]RLB96792.1 MAG: J domain-containing protein [Deltaproteobacteria bacterium]RLC10152.1 MAG: J domain-containing protein [Deltaproteobacteria bacterium]